jgi:hypothetical protein
VVRFSASIDLGERTQDSQKGNGGLQRFPQAGRKSDQP